MGKVQTETKCRWYSNLDDISYSSEDAWKPSTKEVIPESKQRMTHDEANHDDCNCSQKMDKAIHSFVVYGEKKSSFLLQVKSHQLHRLPTQTWIETVINIQLHKANAEEMLLQVLYLVLWSWWYYSCSKSYGEGQATATSSDEEGKKGLCNLYRIGSKRLCYLKNWQAPSGYQLSTDVIKVSASELKAATNLVVDKGTVVNKPFTTPPPQ